MHFAQAAEDRVGIHHPGHPSSLVEEADENKDGSIRWAVIGTEVLISAWKAMSPREEEYINPAAVCCTLFGALQPSLAAVIEKDILAGSVPSNRPMPLGRRTTSAPA